MTLKLVVPDGFVSASADPSNQNPDGRCSWQTSEERFLSVEVGEKEPLADLRDELKQYEDIGGDDEVKDVTYDAPTEAFDDLDTVPDSIELIRS